MKTVERFSKPRFTEGDLFAYAGLVVGTVTIFIALLHAYRPEVLSSLSGSAPPPGMDAGVRTGVRVALPPVDSFGRPIRSKRAVLLVPVVCGPCLDPAAIVESARDVGVPVVVVTRSRLGDVPSSLARAPRLRVLAGSDTTAMLPAELGTPSAALWVGEDGTVSGTARPGETLAQFARRMQQ